MIERMISDNECTAIALICWLLGIFTGFLAAKTRKDNEQ